MGRELLRESTNERLDRSRPIGLFGHLLATICDLCVDTYRLRVCISTGNMFVCVMRRLFIDLAVGLNPSLKGPGQRISNGNNNEPHVGRCS